MFFCLRAENQLSSLVLQRLRSNAAAQRMHSARRRGPTSIYHLLKAFEINLNVGSACGEIVALEGTYGRHLINPLIAVQDFEYKDVEYSG